MKKKTQVALATVIALFSNAAISLAAGEPSLELGSSTAKQGETVTVPVTVTSSGHLRGIQFELEYDHNQLSLVQVTRGEGYPSSFIIDGNPENDRVIITGFDDIPSGTAAQLKFTVNSNATASVMPVSVSNLIVSNEKGEAVTDLQLKAGSISISSGTVNPAPAPGGGGGGGGGGAPAPAPAATVPTPSVEGLDSAIQQLLDKPTAAWSVKQFLERDNKVRQQANSSLLKQSKVTLGDLELNTVAGKTTVNISQATVRSSISKIKNKQEAWQKAIKEAKVNGALNQAILLQVPQIKLTEEMEIHLPSSILMQEQIDHVVLELQNRMTLAIPVSSSNPVLSVKKQKVGNEDAYQLESPVPVQVQWDVPAGGEKLTVFQWKNQSWHPVGGKISVDGKLQATIRSADPIKVAPLAVSYQDLGPVQSWAKDAIETLSGKGYIDGRSQGKFDPMAPITRGEYVQLIVRSLDLKGTAAPNGSFKDVDASYPYQEEIYTAAALSIVSGVGEGKFLPNKPITREEMASIISRTLDTQVKQQLDASSANTLQRFKDQSKISEWAKASVSASVQLEWLKGVKADEFKPKAQATRAQATVMMYQIWSQK